MPMISVKFDQLLLSNMGFVILLKEEGKERTLPIFIGTVEARAIILHVNNIEVPRPLTHDLMKSVLEHLECSVRRVEVCDLKDGTFYARLVIERDGEEIPVDSRPSDAIAVALRFNAPLFVAEEVMEEASHISTEFEAAKAAAQQAEEQGEESGPNQEGESAAPSYGAPRTTPVDDMKTELEKAVAEERYEDAARLRDKIKRFEEKHTDN
jgi:uncharacterized protein